MGCRCVGTCEINESDEVDSWQTVGHATLGSLARVLDDYVSCSVLKVIMLDIAFH